MRQPAGSAHQDVTRGSVSGSVDAPVQRQALALVNEHRRRDGCPDLTLDRRLIAAANRHAADMARRGYFAHSSPDGDGAGERVEDAGYRWSRYRENIARGQASVSEVVDGWMHSPEHRANILDCRLHQIGASASRSPATNRTGCRISPPEAAHPLTEPATMPRMKKRCRDRKTISGTIIVKKPPAVISCQP